VYSSIYVSFVGHRQFCCVVVIDDVVVGREKMMMNVMNETNISIQMNVNGVKKQFDGPSI
jgi:hypothetical protein